MENSLETDFQNSREEGKLYAVDSLNNLNEQSLCVAHAHHQRMYAKCHLLKYQNCATHFETHLNVFSEWF